MGSVRAGIARKKATILANFYEIQPDQLTGTANPGPVADHYHLALEDSLGQVDCRPACLLRPDCFPAVAGAADRTRPAGAQRC